MCVFFKAKEPLPSRHCKQSCAQDQQLSCTPAKNSGNSTGDTTRLPHYQVLKTPFLMSWCSFGVKKMEKSNLKRRFSCHCIKEHKWKNQSTKGLIDKIEKIFTKSAKKRRICTSTWPPQLAWPRPLLAQESQQQVHNVHGPVVAPPSKPPGAATHQGLGLQIPSAAQTLKWKSQAMQLLQFQFSVSPWCVWGYQSLDDLRIMQKVHLFPSILLAQVNRYERHSQKRSTTSARDHLFTKSRSKPSSNISL